ncbi:unnamed protein product [Prorocentrum cordatum]|uniref:Uncharacterized protein n=1 Tax=Prorocentrum cordatum TaxID=2364126 RepID=A0ABN9SWR9_9DINO|nr:unnamed protein product [Polarella glacialis]
MRPRSCVATQRSSPEACPPFRRYSVFSNMTDTLSDDSSLKEKGSAFALPAAAVDETAAPGRSLAVVYGGRWNTALNTDIFNRVWLQIVKLGRYRFHDWSVKAGAPSCSKRFP